MTNNPTDTQAALELLPCPFCGSSNIDPDGVFYYEGGDKTKPKRDPACQDCDATSRIWNTRPAPSEMAEVLAEALRNINDLRHADNAVSFFVPDRTDKAIDAGVKALSLFEASKGASNGSM